MAVQIAWALLFARRQIVGLAAAADRDQAALIAEAVQRIARLNAALCAPLEFYRHQIVNRETGSRLDIISSDVSSSWGALPDFVICDELCHWEKPEMWQSLLSSAAKRPDCLLAVLTNAGVGHGWQWEAREAARSSPDWYFASLAGPHAPWISDRQLREQQALLPRPVYERLWENVWQHSDGSFITLAEAEACRDPHLAPRSHGRPHLHYVAAIDYAEKHDYTVGVIAHLEPTGGPEKTGTGSRLRADDAVSGSLARVPVPVFSGPRASGTRVVVDRMDVVVPRPGEPTQVAWVEEWIRYVAARFPRVTFVVDEYQLVGTIQKLEPFCDIRRFAFRAGRGNHALAITLRKLILHREVAWYPGCGQLPPPPLHKGGTEGGYAERDDAPTLQPSRDDLETELASLLVHHSPSGLCRIDHLPAPGHHDDRAFALGAACLYALNTVQGDDWLHVTPPAAGGGFDW